MEKTGSRYASILLAIIWIGILFFPAKTTSAQNVKVTASLNETVAFTGDRLVLTISVSGRRFKNVSNPSLPPLDGLEYLTTNPSTSTSFSFVNGVSESSYQYSYYLLTKKDGTFTIPSISVEVDGKAFKTDPITVNVQSRTQSAKPGKKAPDIYLKMEVSNKNPYAGEQVIASIVLYFKATLDILSYQPKAGWKAEGFWKEELKDGQQPRAETTIINGIRYRKAKLVTYAIFPSKIGKLTLSPFSVVTTVRVVNRNRDPFSSFFGGFGSNQKNIDLTTGPIEIEVKALPELKNAIYTGAVGNFTIKRSISAKDYLVGESIEINTSITGTGNIALVTKPAIEIPSSFEQYEPQENASINRKGNKVSGNKTFTDIIIPRTPGKFEIPAQRLAYFNPNRKRYEITELKPISLTIKKDPNAIVRNTEQLVLAVQPFMGSTIWFNEDHVNYFEKWWFISLLILPLFVSIGGFMYRSYLDRLAGDEGFARSNRASKKADKRLKSAHEVAQLDIKEAYGDVYNALVGYIADRLQVPESGEEDEFYLKIVEEKGLDSGQIEKMDQLFKNCTAIRFAPITNIDDFEKDRVLATELLKSMRRLF